MKPVRWRVYITLFFLASEIDVLLGKPSRKLRKLGKQTLKTTPKLTRQEWEQLHKFEDALKSEDGKLLFTNSWAVQLDPAEIKVADRIARKHGFINYGQVCKVVFYVIGLRVSGLNAINPDYKVNEAASCRKSGLRFSFATSPKSGLRFSFATSPKSGLASGR